MSTIIQCDKSLTIEKNYGNLHISIGSTKVILYKYPEDFVNEITFRASACSAEVEATSVCVIRIELRTGPEYIFEYSPNLVNTAFADYLTLKGLLYGCI